MKLQNLISSHVSDSGRLRVCGTSNGDRYAILNEVESGANIYNNSNGVVMSRGYNLSSDDAFGILTGPGDLIRTDPMLGPLQNNGGRTLTHALLPDSPAIDAGDPNFTPPPFFDQRGAGHPRVVNGRVDKGSFEVQSGSTPTPTATATATASATATATATFTPTSTPPSPTPTATFTPTPMPTASHTPTPTPPSPTPTATATPSASATPRPTPSPRLQPGPRSRPSPAPRRGARVAFIGFP